MKKSIIADSILVSKYISGDEKSLEILIKRHKQRIYSFISFLFGTFTNQKVALL